MWRWGGEGGNDQTTILVVVAEFMCTYLLLMGKPILMNS